MAGRRHTTRVVDENEKLVCPVVGCQCAGEWHGARNEPGWLSDSGPDISADYFEALEAADKEKTEQAKEDRERLKRIEERLNVLGEGVLVLVEGLLTAKGVKL